MNEAKFLGVEGLSGNVWRRNAISDIAEDRMTKGAQMNSDLMHSSSLGTSRKKRCVRESF